MQSVWRFRLLSYIFILFFAAKFTNFQKCPLYFIFTRRTWHSGLCRFCATNNNQDKILGGNFQIAMWLLKVLTFASQKIGFQNVSTQIVHLHLAFHLWERGKYQLRLLLPIGSLKKMNQPLCVVNNILIHVTSNLIHMKHSNACIVQGELTQKMHENQERSEWFFVLWSLNSLSSVCQSVQSVAMKNKYVIFQNHRNSSFFARFSKWKTTKTLKIFTWLRLISQMNQVQWSTFILYLWNESTLIILLTHIYVFIEHLMRNPHLMQIKIMNK